MAHSSAITEPLVRIEEGSSSYRSPAWGYYGEGPRFDDLELRDARQHLVELTRRNIMRTLHMSWQIDVRKEKKMSTMISEMLR